MNAEQANIAEEAEVLLTAIDLDYVIVPQTDVSLIPDNFFDEFGQEEEERDDKSWPEWAEPDFEEEICCIIVKGINNDEEKMNSDSESEDEEETEESTDEE